MARYLGRPLTDDLIDLLPLAAIAATKANEARTPGSQQWIAAVFKRDDALTVRDALEAGSGLPLAALDIDAAALVNVFTVSHPELATDRTLLIQANVASTVLIGVQGAQFQGAVVRHDAGESQKVGAEAQERAEGLLRIARGIAETVRVGPEDQNKPDHILLSGDLSTDPDFRELLRAHLPMPFGLLNPFRNIPGPDPAEYPEAYPGGPLAATLGLALRLAEAP
jgi:Tfp pilus assembly PilM family ATPase